MRSIGVLVLGFAAASHAQFFVFDEPIEDRVFVEMSGFVHGIHMVAADLNGDGLDDLAVSGNNYVTLLVLLNGGDGRFAYQGAFGQPIGNSPPRSLAIGDIDGDGDSDVVVAGGVSVVYVFKNDGDGQFGEQQAVSLQPNGVKPQGVALADIDNDGDMDALVSNDEPESVSVLFNSGAGGFMWAGNYLTQQGSATNSVATGDFNGDGLVDFVASNQQFDTKGLQVFLNVGFGAFDGPINLPSGKYPVTVVTADFNDDGLPDVACVEDMNQNNGSSFSVLLNAGHDKKGEWLEFDGPETVPLGEQGRTINVGDFDGDGALDIVVGIRNAMDQTGFSLHKNFGDGTFPFLPIFLEAEDFAYAAGAGDFFGDGDDDLAMLCDISDQFLPDPLLVYRNQTTPQSNPGSFDTIHPPDDAPAVPLVTQLAWETSNGADVYFVEVAADEAFSEIVFSAAGVHETSIIAIDFIQHGEDYHWRVTATNEAGSTMSAPSSFIAICLGDANGDGVRNILDFVAFQSQFLSACP